MRRAFCAWSTRHDQVFSAYPRHPLLLFALACSTRQSSTSADFEPDVKVRAALQRRFDTEQKPRTEYRAKLVFYSRTE
jgi:hypothetical protein